MSRKSVGLALVLTGGLSAWTLPAVHAQCGAQLGLGVGVKVINTPNCTDADPNDPPLNVRVCASTGCDVCAWACNGDTGVIQAGPTVAGGYTWWYITWNKLTDCISNPENTGWSVQDDHFHCRLEALPPPTGACCFANGTCQSLTYTNCANLGGTRWSENVACASANCPQPQQPVIEVTPASLSFGDVQRGQSATQSFTVRNVGIGTLSGSASGVSAPFSFPGTTSYNLGAGQQATIQVRFAPTGTGSFSGTVSFSGGGGASRGVSGNGVPVPPARYTLTLQSSPSSGGTISASPQAGGDGKYAAGTQVQVTAYPNTGYTFSSWSGDASGSNYTTTVTMNGDRSVTGNFPDARAGILRVEPPTHFLSSAQYAIGPFNPSSMEYRLTNIGGQPISWALSGGLSPWLNVSTRNGTLQSGQQTSVMVSVNSAGLNFLQTLCSHEDHIEFLNTTNGSGNTTRDVEVTITDVCQVSGSTLQGGDGALPPDISIITMPLSGLRRWGGAFWDSFVSIDPTKPTFIFAHGWEGDPTVWDDTAKRLAASPPYDTANILAWDWRINANPNGHPDVEGFFARIAVLGAIGGPLLASFYLEEVYKDAKLSGENAEREGGALAQVILNSYPSLRTQLHLIGKSHGGGLLAVTASKLPQGHARADSLTMLDTPNRWGVDSMHYLDPQSASRVIVMYYSSLGGVGAPAPSPAINMSLNPEYVDLPQHSHVTDSWFPGLFVNGNGLSIGDAPIDFPHDISTLDPSKWWGETGRYNFQPMGACCTFGLFEGCDERLERDCGSSPAAPRVWAGPQTRCSPYVGCPITVAGSTLEGTGEVAFVPESVHDPFPGMVPILTLPLDSASEWLGDGAVVATGLDPNDPGNSVVFLQEDGDATIYRTFQWPANVFELSFDYMFRDPRGDENLTVYLDDRIVFYDHAGTSLATTGLTRSSGSLVADLAGKSGRLAFVLRTDGIPGGGVLLDNVTLWGFLPGDMDADRHIDLADYAVFQRCFGGNPPELECVLVDFDKDQRVALNDDKALQQCLAGPDTLGDPRCNAPPVCGNGIVEGGEECDPPNGSTCDAKCVGLVQEPDGSIVAWGCAGYDLGQCNVPSPNTGFVAVGAGGLHSLGLKSDGSVVAWGNNGSGQTGVPAPNSGFVGVAAGLYHSLGLKADGSIVAWGCGDWTDYGQCNVPTPNSCFVGVAAGYWHGLGLKRDGSIVAWGCDPLLDTDQCNVPAPNSGFIAVAAGEFHSLGLKDDGSIVAWGDNSYSQTSVPAPNTGFVAIAAGNAHSLGLKGDGSMVGWGRNDVGETNVPAPNMGFVGVAAGADHSLGLKGDGSIVAWGYNYFGQTNVPEPNSGFVAIAAGGTHSLAVRGNR